MTNITQRPARAMLKADEELSLLRAAQSGDASASARLVASHEPMVRKIARGRARGDETRIEDLEQEARIGLLTAIARFDLESGLRLSTFARWHMLAEVADAQRRAPIIRPPSGGDWQRVANRLSRARQKRGMTGEFVTDREAAVLAVDLGATPDLVQEVAARTAGGAFVSLHAPAGRKADDGGTSTVGDAIADPDAGVEQTDAAIDRQRRLQAVHAAVAGLKPRARDIIASRYLSARGMTLDELSHRHGVTRQAINQSEMGAIRALQEMLPARLAV